MLNNLPGHSHRLSGERSVMSQPHPSLDTLIIDDLMEADLPAIAWSGGPGHLRSVARYLARAASGEVEYLAVRTPDGRIVAKAASTTPSIRATAPCCSSPPIPPVTATVGCSSNNPGALRLHTRLGYTECGTEDASWETTDAGGRRFTYRTTLTLLRKQLS